MNQKTYYKRTPGGQKWAVFTIRGYLCLVSLLGFISISSAQQKKDNTVIVQTTFVDAVQKLLDKGYHIKNMNETFKTVETEPNNDIVLYLRQKDDSIYITGEYISGNIIFPIVYWPSSRPWKEMMEYISQFNNVTYAAIR